MAPLGTVCPFQGWARPLTMSTRWTRGGVPSLVVRHHQGTAVRSPAESHISCAQAGDGDRLSACQGIEGGHVVGADGHDSLAVG